MNTSALFLLAFAFFGRLALAVPGPGDKRPANAMSRMDKIQSMYGFEGFVYALDVSLLMKGYATGADN